jgi:histidyl-tRNA synthetase
MNSTPPKTSLKPQLPRGFADRGPQEIAAVERMLAVIRQTYELYGFEAVETPFIEYTDALGKFLPDQDRPNEGVFSFRDDDEQWLSLRYDLTAPLARHVAENFDRLPKPYRSYRAGVVFRNEKPGPGRFRQFMQFDADTVGAPSVIADAEMCMMAADTLERLGIKRGDYVIKVNNRKVLDGVMEAIGLGGAENVGRRLTVLRAIDKLDRLGVDGVRLLLGPGRKDESGDFTKGAQLNDRQSGTVLDVIQATNVSGLKQVLDKVTMNTGGVPDSKGGLAHLPYEDAINELVEQFVPFVEQAGYESDRIRIDPSVVRGLEYYTGPVFEAELTFGVNDERGNPVRFGSVGGGGRYDGLVARFRGEPVPATGFSIGVSRLYAALKLRRGAHRACRRARARSRSDHALSIAGRASARCKHPRRALSRGSRHEGADALRRQTRRSVRHHPRLGRARTRRSADQGFGRGRARRRIHCLECRMESGAPGTDFRAGGTPRRSRTRDTRAVLT